MPRQARPVSAKGERLGDEGGSSRGSDVTAASRVSRKLILLGCVLSFFGPAFMIFLINILFLRDSVVPDIVERPVVSDSSVLTLLELDKMLLSMAIGRSEEHTSELQSRLH